MTPVALIRHFPTDWNLEHRLQGRADRPLTPEARERLAGLRLPPPWDTARIVASPLARARETAESLAEGRPVALDPRLVEQDWGAWEGIRSADLLADPASGFVPTHLMPPGMRPPGGESGEDVWARLRPALAGIAAAGPAVIVAHKAVMRLLLARAGAPTPVEIKRARLYPMALAPDGEPTDPGEPVRLVERAAADRP